MKYTKLPILPLWYRILHPLKRYWKYKLLESELTKLSPAFNGAKYRVFHTFMTLANGDLLIRKNYAWDGPSGPTIDTDTFMRGSLIHDALCQLIELGLLPWSLRKPADMELRRICLEDGMCRFRAWYVYRSVRFYSQFRRAWCWAKTK